MELSKEAAFDFKQIAQKLKGAPLEAYTTPAGALGGLLLTKLLMRRPELRHYLMGGVAGAGAGYAGGRVGRHFLEGYQRGRVSEDVTAGRKAEAAKPPLPEPGIPEAPEPAGPGVEERAAEAPGVEGVPEEELSAISDVPPSVPERLGEAITTGQGIASQQQRDLAIFKLLTPEEKTEWRKAQAAGAEDVLNMFRQRAISRSQSGAQAAAGPVTGEPDIFMPTDPTALAGAQRQRELQPGRAAAASKQQAAQKAQQIREALRSKYGL